MFQTYYYEQLQQQNTPKKRKDQMIKLFFAIIP